MAPYGSCAHWCTCVFVLPCRGTCVPHHSSPSRAGGNCTYFTHLHGPAGALCSRSIHLRASSEYQGLQEAERACEQQRKPQGPDTFLAKVQRALGQGLRRWGLEVGLCSDDHCAVAKVILANSPTSLSLLTPRKPCTKQKIEVPKPHYLHERGASQVGVHCVVKACFLFFPQGPGSEAVSICHLGQGLPAVQTSMGSSHRGPS